MKPWSAPPGVTAGPETRYVTFESTKVAFAMPPKLDQKPGRKLNGAWMANSMPFRLPPVPFSMLEMVQAWPSTFDAAGELGLMIEVGRPVEAKVPVRCINSAGGYRFFTPTAVETNKKYADYDAVTIPDVGHYPKLEKPKEFNEKLRDVLKGLSKK